MDIKQTTGLSLVDFAVVLTLLDREIHIASYHPNENAQEGISHMMEIQRKICDTLPRETHASISEKWPHLAPLFFEDPLANPANINDD